jgi:hypothetical protein
VHRVPEQQRVAPPIQILGPVLESIRYEPEGTPVDEMFSELLSRSMDAERQGEAHPSYPIIIRQLSSDEAKILSQLRERGFEYVYTQELDHTTNLFHGHTVEEDSFPRQGLSYPERVGFYFEHLDKLGLAGIYQHGNQAPITQGSGMQTIQIGTRVICRYRLTSLGQDFMRACSSSKRPGYSQVQHGSVLALVRKVPRLWVSTTASSQLAVRSRGVALAFASQAVPRDRVCRTRS